MGSEMCIRDRSPPSICTSKRNKGNRLLSYMATVRDVFLIALVCVTACAPARANSVHLMNAFQMAIANDPTFLSAGATNRAAQELIPQAKALLLPEIRMASNVRGTLRFNLRDSTTAALGRRDAFFSGDVTLNITQPIYRQDLRIQVKQSGTQVARADAVFAFALQDLIVRVADRYFGVLAADDALQFAESSKSCLLYTSPSPRDGLLSRMPSSA